MITSRDIELAGFQWCFVDEYKWETGTRGAMCRFEPTIVNTDTNGGPGVHWIVALVLPSGERYVYDPLGPKNYRANSYGMPIDPILRHGPNAVHFFPYQSQMENNELCGWHSLYIAGLLREMGSKIANARDADRLIKQQFGTGADNGDIRLLQRAFSQGR